MSELIHQATNLAGNRWNLLVTVCAAALLANAPGTVMAGSTNDADRPTVWIELGGQLERMDSTQARFDAPFEHLDSTAYQPISPLDAQHTPRYAIGGEGKISFDAGHDWVLSAAVRYGRSNGNRHTHQQTHGPQSKYIPTPSGALTVPVPYSKATYADTKAKHKESHVVMDFMAGKDVGLGLFGRNGSSVLSAGVRFAQFSTRSDVDIRARPNLDLHNMLESVGGIWYLINFNNYHMMGHSSRSFRGIGPSIAWEGSAPFLGNADTATFNVDFGINGALLFGRQKARVEQHLTKHHFTDSGFFSGVYTTTHEPPVSADRSRSVAVPNVGGFAGLSLHFPNASVSLGYRADFFFGAMDGGIETRKNYDRNFHGPFASISIGFP